jgi:hypothetical protein
LAASGDNPKSRRPKRAPATTIEGRENQLIALATDVAEKQMRDGKASAQVVVHFLRLATARETLEREKLRKENILLEAKTKALASSDRMEKLYESALRAMRSYQGQPTEGDYDDPALFRANPDP